MSAESSPQGESRQGDRNEKETCWNVPEIDNRSLVLLLSHHSYSSSHGFDSIVSLFVTISILP